ncbi:hypothetical protein GGTG_10810 [Gaeumannomyces tritici R3-111a-1]|uniref:Uncharacterized protein n=1 Tax=Gaeumannomyces tritici (strain R3-111a-1) TaxID=644352 RepID=J3PBD7_GAET3|nr:hypothetical protein GGTG_10810 [Gaeumannomyces tritici R3-111a-1]EJT71553.1 hypothetical protein GGTG_10810 [Gaeumannomyces tritici R3-111a-1]
MQGIAYLKKPVKGMLNAIRQSNYRILNVRYSKKYYYLPGKEIEKPLNNMANGLKRSEPKLPETTFFSLTLQSLPLKLLTPKAALPGANTNAAPLREAARLLNLLFRLNGNGVKLLKNVLGFGFLNGFAGAKLDFNKLFEKFRYCFKKPLVYAYRYTGVNGIILIYLTTKITVTKYRTLRIIVFKKGQINKIPIIALLEINNFLQRKCVANIYVKQGKSNVRFGGKSIKIESVAAAFVARFTLFFGEGFFVAAVKARRGVTGKTFARILKGYKRKRAR